MACPLHNKSQKTSHVSKLEKGEGHETHDNNFSSDNGQGNSSVGRKRPGEIGSQLVDDSFLGIWRSNRRLSADTLFSAFLFHAEGPLWQHREKDPAQSGR